MSDPSTGTTPRRRQRARGHRQARFRAGGALIKFYADTNHNGVVEESEREWLNRNRKPGAIVVYNCDRDAAAAPFLDAQDEEIKSDSELPDLAKLVVKKNPDLPASYKAFLKTPAVSMVRIFDNYTRGALKVIGGMVRPVPGEYEMVDIRTRDYVFALEATQQVKSAAEAEFSIQVIVRDGATEVYNESMLFTIAPWLMLSNLEITQKVYVTRSFIPFNHAFVTSLKGQLSGSTVKSFDSPTGAEEYDIWLQDVMEVGFSSSPQTRSNPMIQYMNSMNCERDDQRTRLSDAIRDYFIGGGFGFIDVRNPGAPQNTSMDSFGNLEVTPPLPDRSEGATYPFGRIYYGKNDSTYGTGHPNQMHADVRTFLDANKYQPPFHIPTNWLAVGHVDEISSFVPNLNATGGAKPYVLLVASPGEAIKICRKIKREVGSGVKICEGRDPWYEVTVGQFLGNASGIDGIGGGAGIRDLNETVQAIIDDIIGIFKSECSLSDDDIVKIPVIFNGTRNGAKSANNAVARTAGIVNCLVVNWMAGGSMKTKILAPKPFGPKNAAGKDAFEEDARAKIERLGLTFAAIDDFETYHARMGEVHCGTNSRRLPPTDWRWWKRDLRIGGSSVH